MHAEGWLVLDHFRQGGKKQVSLRAESDLAQLPFFFTVVPPYLPIHP